MPLSAVWDRKCCSKEPYKSDQNLKTWFDNYTGIIYLRTNPAMQRFKEEYYSFDLILREIEAYL